MGAAIRKEIHLRGYDPKDFVIFAFGGGGPTHVTGYMGEIPGAIIFPFSPVFSALGSSVMDIMHIYEQSRRYMLMEPGTRKFNTDYEGFNSAVETLMEKAKKDLAGEGLAVDKAAFRLELDMLYGGQVHRKRSSSPLLFISSQDDMEAVYNEFEKEFSETFSPLVVHPEGGVYVESFVLTASISTEKPSVPTYKIEGSDPMAARKAKRQCYWGNGGLEDTAVFDYMKLKAGNEVVGPSVLETEYTTVVIPPGYQCCIDEHHFARIERT
jgi:N-methylhydantoinase A/acetophenone carboxylase